MFHRVGLDLEANESALGRRIGMGSKGGATEILSTNVMTLSGITSEDADFVSVGGTEAAEMLINGKLDFAFMVYGFEAPVIQKMLNSKEVLPYSAVRAEAFARRFRFWSIVTLPRGIVDFATDIPAQDVTLLAPAAQLVAPSDFHPALIDLFIGAAEEILSPGGVFEDPGEFPSLKLLDFNTTSDIRRFYRSGPSFLRRYLSFWLANFIDRMKIMLVPLVASLFPFFKLMPPSIAGGYGRRFSDAIVNWKFWIRSCTTKKLKDEFRIILHDWISSRKKCRKFRCLWDFGNRSTRCGYISI